MDPVLKSLLNSLNCPICGSMIDLMSYGTHTTGDYNYCCATDSAHYAVHIANTWGVPTATGFYLLSIIKERVIIYTEKRRYEIYQRSNGTEIWNYEVNGELLITADSKRTIFTYPDKLFDFSQCTKEQTLNRVKTLLVFQ